MANYKNGRVFMVYHKDGDPALRFIGSTTVKISRRMANIRKSYSVRESPVGDEPPGYRQKAVPFFDAVRTHGGWDAWQVELIEDAPCDNHPQLRAREKHHGHAALMGAKLVADRRTAPF